MNPKNKGFSNEKWGWRNSCTVKVGVVGVKDKMTLQKFGALWCETGGQDSFYIFAGATTGFGFATACYCPLRPRSDF